MWPLILSFIFGIFSTIAVEYALVRLAESDWGKRRRKQPLMGNRGNGSKPSFEQEEVRENE